MYFKAGVAIAAILLSDNAKSQTNFYLRTDSVRTVGGVVTPVKPPVDNLKAWTTNSNGTAGSAPKNFTDANQEFIVQTNGYTSTKDWTIAGAGSKLVVGTADSLTSITLTRNFVGTIDVLSGSTFRYEGPETSGLTFGTLATNSTVRFSGSSLGYQKVLAGSYQNLSLVLGGGNNLPVTLPQGVVKVAGIYSPSTNAKPANIYGSTIEFNGNGGQNIPASFYYNLTISGNKNVEDTLRGNLWVAGNLSNTATSNGTKPTTYSYATLVHNYHGLVNQNVSEKGYVGLTFSNGRTFNVSAFNNANKTITLFTKEDVTVGDKIASFTAASTLGLDTSTIVTSITADTILTLNNAPTLKVLVNRLGHALGAKPDTLFATGFSAGNKTIDFVSGSVINVNDTLVGQIFPARSFVTAYANNTATVTTNLTNLNYMGTVVIGSASGKPSDKTISGTVSIYGAFTAGNGNVTTTGSHIKFTGKRQIVPGLTYDNITIDQDSAFTATLAGPALVKGTLTLAAGKLTTTAKNLLTIDANGTIAPVANDTFYVNGPLAKNFASTASFTYPIGATLLGAANGRKVVLTPNTADPKTYTVQFTNGKVANSARVDSLPIKLADTLSYYTVTPSNLTGTDSSAKIKFEYKYAQDVSNAGLAIMNYKGKWISQGTTLEPTSNKTGSITTDNYVTTLGRFVFGFANPGALPVSFGTVNAKLLDSKNAVNVTWESLSETNVETYVVESSLDGFSFKTTGTVIAKKADIYSFMDFNISEGVNYYRIKSIDQDGRFAYSKIVSVNVATMAKLSIYPNPVVGKTINVTVSNPSTTVVSLTLINSIGKTVLTQKMNHSAGASKYAVALPENVKTGTYYLRMNVGASKSSTTLPVFIK